MAKITVKDTEIVIFKKEPEDYISLTDIAKVRDKENPSQIISLWMRTYSTIEYPGLWEKLNNPHFNPHIYEGFKTESAKPHFWMSPQKWISKNFHHLQKKPPLCAFCASSGLKKQIFRPMTLLPLNPAPPKKKRPGCPERRTSDAIASVVWLKNCMAACAKASTNSLPASATSIPSLAHNARSSFGETVLGRLFGADPCFFRFPFMWHGLPARLTRRSRALCNLGFVIWDFFGIWNFGIWDFPSLPARNRTHTTFRSSPSAIL